jgi:hypothetical protein
LQKYIIPPIILNSDFSNKDIPEDINYQIENIKDRAGRWYIILNGKDKTGSDNNIVPLMAGTAAGSGYLRY